MKLIRKAVLTALMCVIPTILSAHPHMWIRGNMEPVLGRRGLTAVHVIWDIDELTSSGIILDYDLDKNGVLSRSEVSALRAGAFEHLSQYEYYLMVEVGNLLATPGRANDFDARIEDGRLIYDFTIPLDITIRWEDLPDVLIFFFDKTYFIDFRPENITDTTVSRGRTQVAFSKVATRSMTQGYGLVEVVGLGVAEMTGQ